MPKTILLTGATDGIGLETARKLAAGGHTLLIHGRSNEKLRAVEAELKSIAGAGQIEIYDADFSDLGAVSALADMVLSRHTHLDILINNAGVYRTPEPINANGMDVRFVVNTIAPYLLTRKLLKLMPVGARVVNLSSAAQAPVSLDALSGRTRLSDMEAYAQSKLAITMWTRAIAQELKTSGPVIVAVNPASLLATKMVKEGFGISGNDIGIGVEIVLRASLSDEFSNRSGEYFDNDTGQFSDPHPAALNPQACADVVTVLKNMLSRSGLIGD